MLGIGPMCYSTQPVRAARPKPKPKPKPKVDTAPAVNSSASSLDNPATQTPDTSSSQQDVSSTQSNTNIGSFDTENPLMSDGLPKKTNGKGSFFGIFTRQNSDMEKGSNVMQSRPDSFDPLDGLALQPCPFIRPLPGHKMIAREEPNQILSMSRTTPSPYGANTTIARCRVRAEALVHESTLAEGDEWQSYEEPSSYCEYSLHEGSELQAYSSVMSVEKQHEYVVLASAPVGNAAAVGEWGQYIKFYSQGYFNLTCPPPPPPRGSTFEYLQAVYPPNEEARLSRHSKLDILWPQWKQERAGALITASMQKFSTRYASLSVFDGNFEIFKAENGYRTSRIERTRSIAAHALLSADVLVVMDTHRDWRFAGNPLVTGGPCIRFFAGAPMLSIGGEVVGVFAIFSREPREDFSPGDRRELAEFAALAMNDLSLQAEYLSDSDLSSPAMQRRGTQTNLFPDALRFHKEQSPALHGSEFFSPRRSGDDFSRNTESSLRSSRDSDVLYMAGSRRPQNRRRGLSAESTFSHHNRPEDFHELMTPTQPRGYRAPSPRPFSSSDLTSIDMEPPNTPNQSTFFRGASYHRDHGHLTRGMSTLSMDSAGSESEYDDDDSIVASSFLRENPDTATPSTHRGTTLTRQSSFRSMSSISTVLSSRIGAPNDDEEDVQYNHGNANAMDSFEIPANENKRVQPYMAEAKFSCAFSAQNLGYDLVYAVEVSPPRAFMSDAELLGDNGLLLIPLAEYGLTGITLNREMHLRALRSSEGSYIWNEEDPQALRSPGAFESGILIPLSFEDGPYRSRCRGVVFGAFRQARFDFDGNLYPSVLNSHAVNAAARALKEILFHSGAVPRRPSTDPTTPVVSSYPANEATEVNYNRLSF